MNVELKEKIKNNIEEGLKNKKQVKDALYNQLSLYIEATEEYKLPKTLYKIGDNVTLEKGTFMHGTRKGIDAIDLIIENGI